LTDSDRLFGQLTTLPPDPRLRLRALRVVADPRVKIGHNNWRNCLYAVVTKAVTNNDELQVCPTVAGWHLCLRVDDLLYHAWDRLWFWQRWRLRRRIAKFVAREERRLAQAALIDEIEAMGDPFAAAGDAPPETIGVTGR